MVSLVFGITSSSGNVQSHTMGLVSVYPPCTCSETFLGAICPLTGSKARIVSQVHTPCLPVTGKRSGIIMISTNQLWFASGAQGWRRGWTPLPLEHLDMSFLTEVLLAWFKVRNSCGTGNQWACYTRIIFSSTIDFLGHHKFSWDHWRLLPVMFKNWVGGDRRFEADSNEDLNGTEPCSQVEWTYESFRDLI